MLSRMSTHFLVLEGLSGEIRIREDERGFLLMHKMGPVLAHVQIFPWC